jgi:hypothetical protein
MVSNVSLHPLDPIDPAYDPAYQDGPPPRPRRPRTGGEIPTDWPVPRIPSALERWDTISIETLEDAIEVEATREERKG